MDESVGKLLLAIERSNGDTEPTKARVRKAEERFKSSREGFAVKLSDLREKKSVLERVIKAVDDANGWCVKASEKLSEMVASRPNLQESKQQIEEIEVD